MTTLEQKLSFDRIIERVEKARLRVNDHHIVKIVAASKYVDAEAIRSLYAIGQRAFGENKVQDLVTKSEALNELPIEWHFIGTLQKNKINHLLSVRPHLLHSIDSLELAQALNERLEREDMTLRALIQINSAYEESKSGFFPEEINEKYAQIMQECPRLHLQGVMSIGAHVEEPAIVRKSFETTRRIFETLPQASVCSMGMSGDFEMAIECGSTMVRLGSILFPKS
ncbi:YggS family pyridoxal phosphate-dependent enzyme [Sulfuricurvum sp. RIFCSPLOWO2_12_FULL_43_24]|uniref:YggS family pyridoxal phosphate-dependent enzyme n=1 Tax=Sulfuricurvum sp. RIFCSPLOWO2_12_FULL_43_24 TaxID=1802247 RepID=UPI0008CC595E|nr:YggS family pyridoxal phosphate-dependent enzyme [Sulfuricurvum sp. RIFCSPLOWO2_12_FULL_43_24]OHD84099.1 MAG: YggS family pyridoxal phosphate enzyme [Sulfuricurvum sp. RIFCSPHIGHO2_12_FULL_44_8]OHD84483.1 MAG: YggS family pyridoxal phosphate enzyme [Sulfuricurvum sp. RIFCSPHIGHO2_02_FULL_43_9]OHD86228.1 MAG: YggS family pyridoxal phosphate enzyme [Sulfuricurvum sp. RIFCSPLOWO2_02_FULL_43_45]OHD86831.1 MAG: YggS family pyridoxal phosphate enzyme [Sulfuricurvum sp. RIFCSPLOWO2_02_43_6]OHD9010